VTASATKKRGAAPKEANLVLEAHIRELGLPFEKEFQFHFERKWRSDYIVKGILVEIEGAVWTQGRHTRGSGYTNDLEKYRTAAALGYKVFRFSTQEVLDGTAKSFLAKWA
jgi:very-short-patch-repair endonuclease